MVKSIISGMECQKKSKLMAEQTIKGYSISVSQITPICSTSISKFCSFLLPISSCTSTTGSPA